MPQVSPTKAHPRSSPMAVSPTSPTSARPRKPVPQGFLAAPRPQQKSIYEMGVYELRYRYRQNTESLQRAGPSTSTYVQRITAEQAAIEDRLVKLGVANIEQMLRSTVIEDEKMNVDADAPPPEPRPITAKQRAIAKFSARHETYPNAKVFTFQEAVEIEQEAHRVEEQRKKEQQERQEAKRRRMGLPVNGERALTREEQDARIWAFMNYKPTDSDLEDDDDDEDEDDEDPAKWFEDDQDDGRKDQDIIEPDEEDYSNVIRIDEARIPQNYFFGGD